MQDDSENSTNVEENLQENLWYEKGLRFSCTECGKCCTGFPGAVWLSEEEILQIAQHLELDPPTFLKRYTRQIDGKISLTEKANYDCVFYRKKKCTIYKKRPSQCRSYPFWPSILKSASSWKEEAKFCEVITDDAPLLTKKEIQTKCG